MERAGEQLSIPTEDFERREDRGVAEGDIGVDETKKEVAPSPPLALEEGYEARAPSDEDGEPIKGETLGHLREEFSMEDQDLKAGEERKRGRPKKVHDSQGQAPILTKRPRGRPPKEGAMAKTFARGKVQKNREALKKVVSKPKAKANEEPKRGRGRPRKVDLGAAVGLPTKSHLKKLKLLAGPISKSSPSASEPTPLKRPRGRPRKVDLGAGSGPAILLPAAPREASRKTLAPKKAPKKKAPKTELKAPEKRGRGRPRKDELKVPKASEKAKPQKKPTAKAQVALGARKKRGRPRKEEASPKKGAAPKAELKELRKKLSEILRSLDRLV